MLTQECCSFSYNVHILELLYLKYLAYWTQCLGKQYSIRLSLRHRISVYILSSQFH